LKGIEILTQLKTGDLNRFQILASPFRIYIIRLSSKKKYALSKEANEFFKTLKINEGADLITKRFNSPDSLFSVELPASKGEDKFTKIDKAEPNYEYLVYDKQFTSTFLIKQVDIINQSYIEEDSFELNVMARGFAYTDDFDIVNKKQHRWQGYYALDVEYRNKASNSIYARFLVSGTRYLMFVLKPSIKADFNHTFFKSIKFNVINKFDYFSYTDTTLLFKVKTPVEPSFIKKEQDSERYYYSDADEEDDEVLVNKYKGKFSEMYFIPKVGCDLIAVKSYRYGYYENQRKTPKDYFEGWKKNGSLAVVDIKEIQKMDLIISHIPIRIQILQERLRC
jgi:hypothetical protein